MQTTCSVCYPRWRRLCAPLGPTLPPRERALWQLHFLPRSSLMSGTCCQGRWEREGEGSCLPECQAWPDGFKPDGCPSLRSASCLLQEGQCEDNGRSGLADAVRAPVSPGGPWDPRHLEPHHRADRHVQLHRAEP